MICNDLKESLEKKPFFNCVGGCGVDLSNGESNCMGSSGKWFKFCPFCGKKIESKWTGDHWEWGEVET